MNKSLPIKAILLLSVFSIAQPSVAKDWFGKNSNPWSNFGGFGNNSDCNDWPDWTPMYWMEEMSGNNDNCDSAGGAYRSSANPYAGRLPATAYGGGYPYQTQSPYAAYGGAAQHPVNNPYAAAGIPAYGLNPYMANTGTLPQSNRVYTRSKSKRSRDIRSRKSLVSPFGNRGLTSLPRYGGSNFANPFSSFYGTNSGLNSPLSSFGGGSPWSSFGSPSSLGLGGMPGMGQMGGFGSPMSMGMPGMNPMSGFGSPMSMGMPGMSPMSGFGSPMSMGMPGMNPMSGFGSPMSMGMPGMNPMSSFGSNPFSGGKSFFR